MSCAERKLPTLWAMAVLFTALAICGLFYSMFAGWARGYWDTYIIAPAMFCAGQPVDFLDAHGEQRWQIELDNRLPHDLVDMQSYGLISKDQRIGSGITTGPLFKLFGLEGFRLFYASLAGLAFALGFSLLWRTGLDFGTAYFFALLFPLNGIYGSLDLLNPNAIGMVGLTLVLLFLIKEDSSALVAGAMFGALGGVRNVAIIFAPVMLILLLRRKRRWRDLLLFGLAAAALIAPYLAWNRFAYGGMLVHPTQHPGLEGFRPTFEHNLLGWRFQFNGLFNWPLAETLIRTPHYPFPNWLHLPLTLLKGFGLLLLTLIVPGVAGLWQRSRSLFAAVALAVVTFMLIFGVQENWEELKTTFLALVLPFLIVLMAHGGAWLSAAPRKRLVGWYIAPALLIAALSAACVFVDLPADQRWYERFPRAAHNDSGLECLPEGLRNTHWFFATRECEREIEDQRLWLARPYLLPRPAIAFTPRAELLRDTWFERELLVEDVWSSIYGKREDRSVSVPAATPDPESQ
ncbi:MAG: hypothetical protein P9M14_04605 [Candidatus Alcyoniella australis]|nr:hypothetical protein [Candidatus Alcyoniella australis]